MYAKPSKERVRKSVMSREAAFGTTSPKYLVFRVGSETTITLKGNTVIWDVPENNHACDHAREHPLAVALFEFLDRRVEWTSRSGGTIVGNDEYNREDDSVGGGGNYVVREYSKAALTSSPPLRTGIPA